MFPFYKRIAGGNFSTLTFQFKIAREVGHYIIDYFIPSIMLVSTSWVTFWLQADNTAPRVTLGNWLILKKNWSDFNFFHSFLAPKALLYNFQVLRRCYRL